MSRHGMRLLLNTIEGPVRKSINVNSPRRRARKPRLGARVPNRGRFYYFGVSEILPFSNRKHINFKFSFQKRLQRDKIHQF